MKLFGKIRNGKIVKLTEQQRNVILNMLTEGYYDDSATPLHTKTRINAELGNNPLAVDNGNHTAGDTVRQPSTFDTNGANFKGQNIVVSDNKFAFYKVKNFGTDNISSTLQLFGRGAHGEKGLRAAIDTLNGAAQRNNRNLIFRTITSETFKNRSIKTDHMSNTFWEFSYDYGNTWYIMKPKPIQNMQQSKVFIKVPSQQSL